MYIPETAGDASFALDNASHERMGLFTYHMGWGSLWVCLRSFFAMHMLSELTRVVYTQILLVAQKTSQARSYLIATMLTGIKGVWVRATHLTKRGEMLFDKTKVPETNPTRLYIRPSPHTPLL